MRYESSLFLFQEEKIPFLAQWGL